jgi:hypothetical protein
MPPARKSATSTPARATKAVRSRASATSAATRREVEQSIKRFEKRLDDSNDALKTLGKHLGRGSQNSYKEVTAALTALRREAAKTNRQALKDFDKLRAAVTQSGNARRSSSATSSRSGTRGKSTTRSTGGRSTAKRASTGGSTTGSRSTKRSASSRSTSSRSTGSRTTRARSTGTRSGGSRSSGSS